MIEGKTIVCFASGYQSPPTSKHHVMHELAERNVVLWVNYHASRAPSVSASDLMRIFRKLKQVAGGMYSPRRNVHVLTPMAIPLPSHAWARRLNRWILKWQIQRAIKKVGGGPVQVWSFAPDVAYLLEAFGPEKVVYYCVDEYSEFTGYDKQQVLKDEAELAGRADLVVTTSTPLLQAKASLNRNTILVPHGVNYEHFSKALSDSLTEPEDLRRIPHPRLGFFGLIRDWVDVGLLAAVAREKPEWQFVLLGDATVDLSPYRAIANMHFLGRKPYAELPAYCKGFDLGLIPFVTNDLTHAVNPIKLREYLAAGLPVISTPMPEVQQMDDLVAVVEGPRALIEAAERLLKSDPADRFKRSQAVSGMTWPARVGEICDHLCRKEGANAMG